MNKCLWIFLGIILYASAEAHSQRIAWQKPVKATEVYTDPNCNTLIVTTSGELIRLNKQGEETGKYSSPLGAPSYVDYRNPSKILLWFQDFQTIILLDNFLNEINQINLKTLSLNYLPVVAFADDFSFWAFNQQQRRLEKIGFDGIKLTEGNRLLPEDGKEIYPKKLINGGKNIFLLTTKNQILVFDNFGTLRSRKTLPEDTQLRSTFDGWLKINANASKAIRLNQNFDEISEVILPEGIKNLEDIIQCGSVKFVLTKNALILYEE